MMFRELLLNKLTPFGNRKKLLRSSQNTTDIIITILNAHKIYESDYDKICLYFWKGDIKKTCEFIWQFMKDNIKYRIEPDSRQSVKSPSAIISTGIYKSDYNDCKHYSQMAGGILSALCRKGKMINWCYRFANYKMFNTQPHHVFIVVNCAGKEIWIDAVLNNFNNKKAYINKIDKKV